MGCLIILLALGKSIACGIDWQVPKNHFDGVNEWGQLSYWRGIGTLDLGEDLKLPLVIGFNPTRRISPFVGKGWIIPILESNIVQVDEKKFLLTQPDGVSREFWRKSSTDTILQGQGNWKGEINGNQITLWAVCGWKLTFDCGKMTTITTPKNRVITLKYNNGIASEVQEADRTILKVDNDPRNGTAIGLTYGKNVIHFNLGEMPRVEVIEKMKLIGGIDHSLNKIIFPDGSEAIYEFGIDDKMQPTLAISGDTDRNFTWDPTTGQALKDGNWTYDIKLAEDIYSNAQIGRTNKENQREFWFKDIFNGVETTLNTDGTKTVVTCFPSGILNGQLRKIEKFKNDSLEESEKFDYDEIGRVLRLNGGREKISYEDQPNGNLKIAITEGDMTRMRIFDKNGNIIQRSTEGL